jgi:hypothetical protein
MAHEKQTVPADLDRIDVTEDFEVRFWCTHFNVGRDELLACILEVGPQVSDVERKLKDAARKAFQKMGED